MTKLQPNSAFSLCHRMAYAFVLTLVHSYYVEMLHPIPFDSDLLRHLIWLVGLPVRFLEILTPYWILNSVCWVLKPALDPLFHVRFWTLLPLGIPAYVGISYLPALFRRLMAGQQRHIATIWPADSAKLARHISPLLAASHRLTYAFLVAYAVVILREALFGPPIAYLSAAVLRILDFPIALAGLLLPHELRGFDLFFGSPEVLLDFGLRLQRHLILGTVVYFLIFVLIDLILWAKGKAAAKAQPSGGQSTNTTASTGPSAKE